MGNRKRYLTSVASTMAMILLSTGAVAQEAQEDTQASSAQEEDKNTDIIVVTGIRGSLKSAMGVKRDSNGIVDAISAEDMGKFPDTNLAESLQRITGVSIDRQNGEGSKVTVRGFGPDFNLVTLNGRQMPVSTLLDEDASTSRSFDFGNLASEGVSGVQVYKTGRASIPTGGIGSTINILTTRPLENPGMHATFGAKGVIDTSSNNGSFVTPEFSGLYSNTFAEDKFGVAVSGSYQQRDSGYNQASVANGWRSHKGATNDWGSLPQIPDGGTEADINTTNRPGPTDTYSVPQNFGYNYTDVSRERINGQLTMQFKPTDNLKATLDYTHSQNKVETTRNDLSVWFNFADVTSEWGDGPLSAPLVYSEAFATPSDLSMGAGQYAVKSVNKSLGFNLEWTPIDNLTLEFDIHDSSAESGADSPYGSNAVVGTAGLYVARQTIDFTDDLPVLSIEFPDGQTGIDASQMMSTGTSFRNSYMRNDVTQAQFKASYDFDDSIVSSIDFGVSHTKNKVRSAYSNAQRDTWGGAGPASDLPDDIFELINIPNQFSSVSGSDNPAMIQEGYTFDFEQMVGLIDDLYGACGGTGQCASNDFTTDRRTTEKSISAYAQANFEFEINDRDAHFVTGLRYEETDVTSAALVPIPIGTQWVAANEYGIIFSDDQDFTELTGEYSNWLPSFDFDVEVVDDVVFRASYSQTIARPGYGDIQGGQTISNGFRINGGTGSQGDPGLKPFKSKNIDFSAEWYYDDASYFAVGYFRKNVSNFIGTSVVRSSPFGLPHPGQGQLVADAQAALGDTADSIAIRNWIFANAPASAVEITGTDSNGDTTGNIFGQAGDPDISFDITVPVNARTAKLNGFEFALQHTFGDTGFGFVANYTIVNNNLSFDNTVANSDYVDPQFALLGLSDTANFIGFYDKDGLQIRIAYNWRDKFLLSTATGSGANNPQYTEAYSQVDANISYEFEDGITVFAEGINLTNSIQRVSGRTVNNALYVTQAGRRFMLGARYKF